MSDYFRSLKEAKCNKVVVSITLLVSHLRNLRIQISSDIIHTYVHEISTVCQRFTDKQYYLRAPPLHKSTLTILYASHLMSVNRSYL